jgi:hypothetical protein
MSILAHVLSVLSNPAVIAVLSMVIEAALRLIPSEKPLSLLHALAKLLHLIGDAANGVAGLLDKVLPQNLVSQDAAK